MSVKGADEFINAQRAMLAKAPIRALKLVNEVSNSTRSQAVRLAPIRTGYLRNHITPVASTQGLVITGIVYGNAYNGDFNYGYAQENGTNFIGAKQFMFQAFEAHKLVFASRLKEILHG